MLKKEADSDSDSGDLKPMVSGSVKAGAKGKAVHCDLNDVENAENDLANENDDHGIALLHEQSS